MAGETQGREPRPIVIPRPLEGFFYERLMRRFAERGDLCVIVDRRTSDRRQAQRPAAPSAPVERRKSQRRRERLVWSLADLPPLPPSLS